MTGLGLPEALQIGLEWQNQTGAAIVHVVLLTRGDSSVDLAEKLVVARDGRVEGSFPDTIHPAAVLAAQEALGKRRSRVYSVTPSADGGAIVGLEGGEVDLFVEVLSRPLSLVIVGAGHIAQPLCAVGAILGFEVVVVDDRPEFANQERFPTASRVIASDFVEGLRQIRIDSDTYVVLVTRGHVHDAACLRFVLDTDVGYIGMIGSRKRIRTVLDSLGEEGFSKERLAAVYAPVGIDIGAHSPPEIAVAIAAELIDVQRGGKAPHLKLARAQ